MLARSFYARFGKRLFDLAVAVPGLIASSPLLLLIAAAIKLTSKGPVLFRQERLGKGGMVFSAFKFRTMTDKPRVPDTIAYMGDPSEVTAVGRLLRRTKFDELPQLLNVLRGEMSIVGPRPQLPVQLRELDENGKLRLLVRPGLTGMAQTHGNVHLTWPERWFYDAHYVKNISMKLDLWLMSRTIGVILHGEDRYIRKPMEEGR